MFLFDVELRPAFSIKIPFLLFFPKFILLLPNILKRGYYRSAERRLFYPPTTRNFHNPENRVVPDPFIASTIIGIPGFPRHPGYLSTGSQTEARIISTGSSG